MKKSNFSRVLPILLIVFVVILSIAAIVVLVKKSQNGGQIDEKQTESETSRLKKILLDTSPDMSIRMSVRGQLVSDEEFNSYQMTISPSTRSIQLYDGYLDRPLNSEKLGNNKKAYEEFVYTLERAGFISPKEEKKEQADLRGVCASGNIYIFDILRGDKVEKSYWTTTCKDVKGDFTANLKYVRNVFYNQIPKSVKLIKSISDTKKF